MKISKWPDKLKNSDKLCTIQRNYAAGEILVNKLISKDWWGNIWRFWIKSKDTKLVRKY